MKISEVISNIKSNKEFKNKMKELEVSNPEIKELMEELEMSIHDMLVSTSNVSLKYRELMNLTGLAKYVKK